VSVTVWVRVAVVVVVAVAVVVAVVGVVVVVVGVILDVVSVALKDERNSLFLGEFFNKRFFQCLRSRRQRLSLRVGVNGVGFVCVRIRLSLLRRSLVLLWNFLSFLGYFTNFRNLLGYLQTFAISCLGCQCRCRCCCQCPSLSLSLSSVRVRVGVVSVGLSLSMSVPVLSVSD